MLRLALERINQEEHSKDEILSILKEICHSFGIVDFSLSLFYDCNDDSKEKYFTYNTFPHEWVQYIIKEKLYLHSPLFLCLKKLRFPFLGIQRVFRTLQLSNRIS